MDDFEKFKMLIELFWVDQQLDSEPVFGGIWPNLERTCFCYVSQKGQDIYHTWYYKTNGCKTCYTVLKKKWIEFNRALGENYD